MTLTTESEVVREARWCGRRRLAAVAALALAALVGPAMAQLPTAAQQSAIKQNCAADFQAHCAGIAPGGSAALSCLQQNAANLSAGCQGALAALSGGTPAG